MIKTRFAPSPTGYLHIGGARTALFCWLFARQQQGQFVLRIEDTDLQRSTAASKQAILEAMQWLGLDYDEGPIYQTERFDRYRQVADQLLESGHAYHCYCTRDELDALRAEQIRNKQKPRYDGRYRDYDGPPRSGVDPVLRFKNPAAGKVEFDDLIRGTISIANDELDDLVILRPDGSPTYNFCVVVDDMDMAITDVIRGDDHINNTPRQINIFQALGAQPPRYGHLPMILGADGSRLSKRHGAVSVMQYRDDGFLPEALLNYLVRLGWSHGDQELFSREQMIDLFSLGAINKSASTFNPDKLAWVNQQYLINAAQPDRLAALLREHLQRLDADIDSGPPLPDVIDAYRERGKTLHEIAVNCLFLYKNLPPYDKKTAKQLNAASRDALATAQQQLSNVADWHATALHDAVQQTVATLEVKFGKVGAPLRAALTGGAPAPGIDQTLALLGKQRSLQRIAQALVFIDTQIS